MADKKFDTKNLKAQELIKSKIEELEQHSKPEFKTKMTITILGDRYNLHVLKEEGLVDVYSWLYAQQTARTYIGGLMSSSLDYQGSTLSAWMSDVESRLRLLKVSNTIKGLKKKLDILEDKLSTGKKDEILLSGIFDELGI